MKKNVFISSTYLDLKPHREAIWALLQSYNVNILGMEVFGARKDDPLKTCLDEVADSNIFVCIISMKYGSIEKKSGKSFTQLEYEKAVELGLDILIYLIDENKGIINPISIDFGTRHNKLAKFKEILKKKHTVDFFTDEKNLIEKLKVRLESTISLRKNSIRRPKIIDARITKFRKNEKEWIIFVGYINGEPYEIHSGYSEFNDFPIPNSIKKGFIEFCTEEKRNYYSFLYIDRFGYKNTIGGIDYEHNFLTKRYDKIISRLLQQDTPIEIIIEVVNEMDVIGLDDSQLWKKLVIKSLKY